MWYLLWIFLAMHGDLEAVTEVYVNNFPTVSIEHEIRRVTVTKSEYIPDHGHDR